jgi:hypothetical protein
VRGGVVVEVRVRGGLQAEELAAEGARVDVEFACGGWAVRKGFGEERVVGWDGGRGGGWCGCAGGGGGAGC